MAMTPEAKVKKVVTKQLKEIGAYYFFPGMAEAVFPILSGVIKVNFLV